MVGGWVAGALGGAAATWCRLLCRCCTELEVAGSGTGGWQPCQWRQVCSQHLCPARPMPSLLREEGCHAHMLALLCKAYIPTRSLACSHPLLQLCHTAPHRPAEANYEGLTRLHERYKEFGFEVLAFPCNQVGALAGGLPCCLCPASACTQMHRPLSVWQAAQTTGRVGQPSCTPRTSE